MSEFYSVSVHIEFAYTDRENEESRQHEPEPKTCHDEQAEETKCNRDKGECMTKDEVIEKLLSVVASLADCKGSRREKPRIVGAGYPEY